MRLAVLASADSWYLKDLRRAAGPNDETMTVDFSALSAAIGDAGPVCFANVDETGRVELDRVDCVLVRTMPPASLEQVVFRMDVLARLEAAGVAIVNRPRAVEGAVDKYLTSAKLAAASLPTPPTIVCQTVSETLRAFETLGGDVVLKPLFGGEGRGITRISDESLIDRAAKMLVQMKSVIYMQPFIPHEGFDIRVFIVGEKVLTMRRRHPTDWRTNVSRGAIAEPYDASEEMIEMGRRAAKAVGATLAGVDLLTGKDGKTYVLEVNAVPGWKALAQALGVDVAALVWDHLRTVAAENGRG